MATSTAQTVGFGTLTLSTMTVSILSQIVTAPFLRVSSLSRGNKVARSYREYLAGASSHYGKFYSQDLTHPDGTIFLITSGWKRRGTAVREGSVFLRVREDGALWQIGATLPDSQEHNLGGTFPVLRARGDILGAADLPQYGLAIPGYFAGRYLSTEEIEECFVFDQLNPQRTARPNTLLVPQAAGGVKVLEVATAPVRRLRRPTQV
jgi:hypothetical protein